MPVTPSLLIKLLIYTCRIDMDQMIKGQIKTAFSTSFRTMCRMTLMMIRMTKFGQLRCDFCATFRISNQRNRMINFGES